LQRYSLSIRQRDAQRLLAQGDIGKLLPGSSVQVGDIAYDATLGAANRSDRPGAPDRLMV
jgi:hypothetical protein